jgi:hypothetical protein
LGLDPLQHLQPSSQNWTNPVAQLVKEVDLEQEKDHLRLSMKWLQVALDMCGHLLVVAPVALAR